MANKPLYYGSSKSSPMYYGVSSGGKSGSGPIYYGAGSSYGAPAYGQYGQYGGVYGGRSSYGGEDADSVTGKITLSRILRVLSQRWLSVFVFVLVGMIISFAVYRVSPTIYEASSWFTMDIRRTASNRAADALEQAMPDLGVGYAEIFNTRLPTWRSQKILTKIVDEFHSSHPASTLSDEELIVMLGSSTLELQRNSRIITVSVRSRDPKIAAALATAYCQAIESLTDEENKLRCDKAVSQIHANVEKKRREKEKVAKQILDFRTVNKVDNLRSSRDTIQQSLSKTTADILQLEGDETQLVEWEKMLKDVQKSPESFGSLSIGVPRAQEIATEFRAFQDASSEYQKLQFAFTDNHPDVIAKKKELEVAKQRFLDATSRALQTGVSTLMVTRNQLSNLRAKRDELRNQLSSVEQRIVFAESGLSTLESEFEIAGQVLQGLILDENKARLQAESNNEIVTVGGVAQIPTKPVAPNPLVIFGIGGFASIALGILFCLIMDNFEDTVVNLADIEGRLSLKVLAVLPHVHRKTRERVAKFLIDDKYSQFSEAVAGLRNLFDSPRYETLSKCLLVISTQPGEGKTITSTSIAISYAQTGRKVLHVDFDLRRPRLGKVWGIELTEERSFSHYLQNAHRIGADFSSLVNKTEISGLDVVCSLPPEGVTPSSIFGSAIVSDFFQWARQHYDHIIVDSPPFGIVGDVVSLSVLADSVIIMCCPDRTHFNPIQYCTRSLTEAGANIIGVVVNDVEVATGEAFSPVQSHSRYGGYGYGGYGYGYGYGYGHSKKRKKNAGDGDNPKQEAMKSATAVEANAGKTATTSGIESGADVAKEASPASADSAVAPKQSKESERKIKMDDFTDEE